MSDPLIFSQSPTVTFATNTFLRVPVILQQDASPLIEVVQTKQAGFTTKFHIYHPDGTDLAVVVGSRLILRPDGQKAGLKMHHPAGKTVCELDGQTLFEIRRTEAAALSTAAELYTPTGVLIRAAAGIPLAAFQSGQQLLLNLPGMTIISCTFTHGAVGVVITMEPTARAGPSPVESQQAKADLQRMLRNAGQPEAADFLDHGSFGLNRFEDLDIGIHLRTPGASI